jgi:hypothetical protein
MTWRTESCTSPINILPVEFHLSSRVMKNGIDSLWRELGRRMNLTDLSSWDEIAQQVISRLSTEHIVIVFHDLDCIKEDDLIRLTQDFWAPLSMLAKNTFQNNHDFYLLMFLLDHEGCIKTWDYPPDPSEDKLWQVSVPFKLDNIKLLSAQELTDWIDQAMDILPAQAITQIDNTVNDILSTSDGGVPEKVFRQIFNLCGCSWQQEEPRWINL